MRITLKAAISSKGRKKGGKCQFKGLCHDAKQLRVSPSHLWRVLVGARISHSLRQRYDTLKSQLVNTK